MVLNIGTIALAWDEALKFLEFDLPCFGLTFFFKPLALTSCLTGRLERCLFCVIMQRSEMATQNKQRGGLSELKHLVITHFSLPQIAEQTLSYSVAQ